MSAEKSASTASISTVLSVLLRCLLFEIVEAFLVIFNQLTETITIQHEGKRIKYLRVKFRQMKDSL